MGFPQAQHGLLLLGGPGSPPHPLGPARARGQGGEVLGIEAPEPAIDRRPRAVEAVGSHRHAVPLGALDAAQPVLRDRIEPRWARQLPRPPRETMDDAKATAQPALLQPATIALAMLSHE